jgi:peptidoglycan/LPS O-acetylase OafA/YrhL
MGPREYRFINLFRALAALWVLVAHCMIWGGWYGLPVPPPKIAVDLFMLVSGFLMAANATDRWDREPLSEPGARMRFWMRRFFRIAPAYYLALAVTMVFSPIILGGREHLQALSPMQWAGSVYAQPVRFTLDNVLMHVSFLFGLHPDYASSTALPDWSLGLEMQFYLAFPLLFLWLRTPLRALVAGLIVFTLGRDFAISVAYPEPSLLAFKLHYFLAGMLLYQAVTESGAKRTGAIAAALVLSFLDRNWHQPALLLSMFALALLERDGQTPAPLAAVIDSRIMRFASDVSYSVYLFHGRMIGTFGALLAIFPADLSPMARTALLFAFVLPTSYAISWVVYRWVELPGIALGKRVVGRRRAVPAT